MILQARELSRTFRGGPGGGMLTAVDAVSLDLPRASITALVGESGSGKSTLARVMARLIPPTGGDLLLDGEPVRAGRRGGREYARHVQMILQDPFASLNPVHDVRYHLARPLQVHRADHGDDKIIELLERVSLTPGEHYVGKYPHELSGGQRQRVAIARALAVRPRVLLADEPVSMLDVSIRLGVLNLLADLRERDGVTILYITHDIASARYLADQIAVMYRGQVVESGPALQVTDAPAHPYTQLLLSAAPDPDRVLGPAGEPTEPGASVARGQTGAGAGADPGPAGCRFAGRCQHALAICRREAPQLTEVGPGHASRCWLHPTGRAPAQEGGQVSTVPR